jgi:hypothetical protein
VEIPPAAGRPASGTLPFLGRAFLDVLPLAGRWETWAVAAAPCAANYGARRLVEVLGIDLSGRVAVPLVGPLEFDSLIFWALTYALWSAGILLLIPLCEGRRGLQFRFVGRHVGAAAMAAAILLAVRAVSLWGVPRFPSGLLRDWWLVSRVLAFAVPFAAWIAFARVEESEGRRAPGLGDFVLPGLVTGLASLTLPSYAVPAAWRAAGLRETWGHADLDLLFFVLYTLLAVLGEAWLLRTLILGRGERSA